MTKNNLKVVKTDNKKQQELKEKNKSLEANTALIINNALLAGKIAKKFNLI